jgi:hypothetical protein
LPCIVASVGRKMGFDKNCPTSPLPNHGITITIVTELMPRHQSSDWLIFSCILIVKGSSDFLKHAAELKTRVMNGLHRV